MTLTRAEIASAKMILQIVDKKDIDYDLAMVVDEDPGTGGSVLNHVMTAVDAGNARGWSLGDDYVEQLRAIASQRIEDAAPLERGRKQPRGRVPNPEMGRGDGAPLNAPPPWWEQPAQAPVGHGFCEEGFHLTGVRAQQFHAQQQLFRDELNAMLVRADDLRALGYMDEAEEAYLHMRHRANEQNGDMRRWSILYQTRIPAPAPVPAARGGRGVHVYDEAAYFARPVGLGRDWNGGGGVVIPNPPLREEMMVAQIDNEGLVVRRERRPQIEPDER